MRFGTSPVSGQHRSSACAIIHLRSPTIHKCLHDCSSSQRTPPHRSNSRLHIPAPERHTASAPHHPASHEKSFRSIQVLAALLAPAHLATRVPSSAELWFPSSLPLAPGFAGAHPRPPFIYPATQGHNVRHRLVAPSWRAFSDAFMIGCSACSGMRCSACLFCLTSTLDGNGNADAWRCFDHLHRSETCAGIAFGDKDDR